MKCVSVRITESDYKRLYQHLFPRDEDEHAAVLGVGVTMTRRGIRLLVRRVFIAQDGTDYVEGDVGYRKLTAEFVTQSSLACEAEGLGYIAVHCHGGSDTVTFSQTDLDSHSRGYPALLDNLRGMPVGALVFAKNAVAGDFWMANGDRYDLDGFDVVGNNLLHLNDGFSSMSTSSSGSSPVFDRQVRMFGDVGQARLSSQKVAVIGAGGVGAMIIEQLTRMGVGEVVVIDDDRLEDTNLNRLVGSGPTDLRHFLHKYLPFLSVKPRFKVDIARRLAKRSGAKSIVRAVPMSVARQEAASMLVDCDYIFLAADTAQARLVYNAVIHQYLIPGTQAGVKIQVDKLDGSVVDISTWVRRTIPGAGCFWCGGLISSKKLQEESLTESQKRSQVYIIDEQGVHAPSIIMLNGIVASHAVDSYVERVTGLMQTDELNWLWYRPMTEEWSLMRPSDSSDTCPECSIDGKRFAMGDGVRLPVGA